MYDNPMHHVSMPNILEGESYVDACVRNIPPRERALTGISLRIMWERMNQNNETKVNVLNKYFAFVEQMTNEEYEMYEKLYSVVAISPSEKDKCASEKDIK